MAGKKKGASVPAVPYVPTESEATVLNAQRSNRKARIRPKMKVGFKDADGKRAIRIEVDHKDADAGYRLVEASMGTSDHDFARLMLAHVAGISTSGTDGGQDQDVLNGHLGIVQGIQPRDEIEALLAVQMAAIHGVTMRMASNLHATTNVQTIESFERSMNRCARTFATQIEALKRYRSKGDQKVVVEHRHYHVAPGAQAVFGDVTAANGGGVDQKNEDQSHERDDTGVRIPERPPVLGAVEADRLPLQSAGAERQEGMPVSWRKGWSAVGVA